MASVWEDVKAMFNGGSRKRAMSATLNSVSKHHQQQRQHQEIVATSASNSQQTSSVLASSTSGLNLESSNVLSASGCTVVGLSGSQLTAPSVNAELIAHHSGLATSCVLGQTPINASTLTATSPILPSFSIPTTISSTSTLSTASNSSRRKNSNRRLKTNSLNNEGNSQSFDGRSSIVPDPYSILALGHKAQLNRQATSFNNLTPLRPIPQLAATANSSVSLDMMSAVLPMLSGSSTNEQLHLWNSHALAQLSPHTAASHLALNGSMHPLQNPLTGSLASYLTSGNNFGLTASLVQQLPTSGTLPGSLISNNELGCDTSGSALIGSFHNSGEMSSNKSQAGANVSTTNALFSVSNHLTRNSSLDARLSATKSMFPFVYGSNSLLFNANKSMSGGTVTNASATSRLNQSLQSTSEGWIVHSSSSSSSSGRKSASISSPICRSSSSANNSSLVSGNEMTSKTTPDLSSPASLLVNDLDKTGGSAFQKVIGNFKSISMTESHQTTQSEMSVPSDLSSPDSQSSNGSSFVFVSRSILNQSHENQIGKNSAKSREKPTDYQNDTERYRTIQNDTEQDEDMDVDVEGDDGDLVPFNCRSENEYTHNCYGSKKKRPFKMEERSQENGLCATGLLFSGIETSKQNSQDESFKSNQIHVS